ncbi:MAG: hypothetical protein FK734_12515 [Asgard group archaeon]|nr:hypothetical protein [Asgard group archaeon]
MRPPECGICYRDVDLNDKGGGLIYFKKRFSDRVWQRKMERIGGVGHPPYAEWFCSEHYERAEDLKDLTIDKAMEILRKEEEEKKQK